MARYLSVGTDAGSTPPIGEALADAGIYPIGGYISQCHISPSHYIATKPIFDFAVSEERQTRSPETII